MPLSYITGSATQGSADAFVESQIATALAGQTGRAFRIREIGFEFVAQSPVAAGAVYELAISRRSQAAMPNVTDRNVIVKDKRIYGYVTSGLYALDYMRRYTYTEDDNVLVVEDPLYLQLDSAATTAVNTVYCRIGYELVNISANDRLALALQSLNEA